MLEFLQRKDQFLFAWPVEKFCKLSSEMQRSYILAYAYLMKFGEESLVASMRRQQLLEYLTKQIKLVTGQKYLDIDYKGLTELLHKPASLTHFTALCERACQIQKNQSDLQKATSRIMEIRTQLCNSTERTNGIDSICPYCGQEWETREALNQQFHETTERLSQIFGRESTAFDDVLKELQTLFEKELKEPLEQKMYELNSDLALQIFIGYSSANEIKVQARLVQQLLHAVKADGLSFEWGNTREECLSEAAKRISPILVYSDQISTDYLEAAGTYDFDETFQHYFHCDPNRITIAPNQVKNKLLYVQQAYYRSFDSDRERLRVLVQNTTELSVLCQQLHAYEKAYTDALKAYRETIISQIEIPFFLYTSRILQSYQGGQGILIQSNGKNIRFVSPGGEHDVLYTMSSGQLSAILMAFSLAINKIYSTERFQTLLIDDPIQCMDDINMISLIEVLHSDFSDMQIVLSTHEDQFANYIAYKYGKYNLPRKSISLKDVHMDETQVHL